MPNLEEGELVLRSYPCACDECGYSIPPRTYHFEYYGQRPKQPVRLRSICQECLDAIYEALCRNPDFDWTPGSLTEQLKEDFPKGFGSSIESRAVPSPEKRRSTASPFASAAKRKMTYRSPGRIGVSSRGRE